MVSTVPSCSIDQVRHLAVLGHPQACKHFICTQVLSREIEEHVVKHANRPACTWRDTKRLGPVGTRLGACECNVKNAKEKRSRAQRTNEAWSFLAAFIRASNTPSLAWDLEGGKNTA
eukprot:scaffold121_cov356-Pavlova_lutheri.AAC.19